MGFQRRTDTNKRILKISTDALPVFHHYGVVKNTYIMLKGSVPGPVKRLITMRNAENTEIKQPQLLAINA